MNTPSEPTRRSKRSSKPTKKASENAYPGAGVFDLGKAVPPNETPSEMDSEPRAGFTSIAQGDSLWNAGSVLSALGEQAMQVEGISNLSSDRHHIDAEPKEQRRRKSKGKAPAAPAEPGPSTIIQSEGAADAPQAADKPPVQRLILEDVYFQTFLDNVILPDGRDTTDPSSCDLCDGDYHMGGPLWEAIQGLPVDYHSGCVLVELPCGCRFSNKRIIHLMKTKRLASCPYDNEEKGCNKPLYFLKFTFQQIYDSYKAANPALLSSGSSSILPWEQDEEEKRIRKREGGDRFRNKAPSKANSVDNTDAENVDRYHALAHWRDNLPRAEPTRLYEISLMRWLRNFDWGSTEAGNQDIRITKQHMKDGIKATFDRISETPTITPEYWTMDFYVEKGSETSEPKLDYCVFVKELVMQTRLQAGILQQTHTGQVVDNESYEQQTDGEKRLHWLMWIFATWPLTKEGLEVWDKRDALSVINASARIEAES